MRILGSDYDGTLNHHGIDDKKKEMLQKWRDSGNIFALISGRNSGSVLKAYQEEQFPCDYLIAANGAIIMNTDGTVISDVRCDGSLALPLLKFLFEKGCPFAYLIGGLSCTVYADAAECENANGYTLETLPKVPYFNQISTRLPYFQTAAEVTDCIRREFGDALNPLQNGACIDIVRADMNKAKGLRILADSLGVPYSGIIAVGDNINDSDMISEFRSYAMENGVDAIKVLADFVTPGIAELIEKELSV